MNVTVLQEAAEAIDAALYETGFEALGNTEDGRVDWWHRGERRTTKQLQIQVARGALVPLLDITCTWPSEGPDHQLWRASTKFTIPCDGSQTRDNVIDATTHVMIKILELYRSILDGSAPRPQAEAPDD